MIIVRPELPDKDAAMSLCAMGRLALLSPTNYNRPTPVSPSPSVIAFAEGNATEEDRPKTSVCSTEGKLPLKKRPQKIKESKREPRVPFEEMKRLMRVYGPTKCLRNRTPKDSGKCTKVLSVKRKFYRWFPDFHERFELQQGDWYKPKIGHEAEMNYREELRKKDQKVLAAKRLQAGKKNSEKKAAKLGLVIKEA